MIDRPKPYVGVSGVVNTCQQRELRKLSETFGGERTLALGVKATEKTQWMDIENKYGSDWYPVGTDILGSVTASGQIEGELRVAQVFMNVGSEVSKETADYESKFISQLMGRTAHWLNAIQFDMLAWDKGAYVKLFEEIKERDSDVQILLQCQKPLMEEYGPKGIIEELKPYREVVDHILFDASHGTGTRLDAAKHRPFVEEASQLPWMGIGIAGGLNGSVVREELGEIMAEYPFLNLDAEGQLHKNQCENNRKLNMNSVKEYFEAIQDITDTD